MEKTKRLKKFNLGSIDEIKGGTFNNLVTWDLQPVEVVSTIKTTSGDRLLAILRGENYDTVHTYTLDGRCVGSTNGDLDLYIDDAINVWFNLYIYDGTIQASEGYLTEHEAIKYKRGIHFDTIKVEISSSEVLSRCKTAAEESVIDGNTNSKSAEIHYVYKKSN